MARRLSRATGRLTGGARKLRLGRLKEGEVALLGTGEAFSKGRRKGIWVEYGVRKQATALVDARRLVRMVELALAEQFSADLKAQRRPDTGAVYYKWSGQMRQIDGRSVDPRYLIQSGKLADRWWISKVSGSIYRARAKLRPTIDGRKLKRVNDLRSKHGLKFQSTRGRAAKTIEQAARAYQRIMVNPPANVPTKPELGETDLKRAKR